MTDFVGFPKIARLSRNCVITEKIDGTNAQICITEDGQFLVGSRTRWITPENDNAGFAKWAHANREELTHHLGVGSHFGEWWGAGIQRTYGMKEKVFSLFNTARWNDETKPPCCRVVPVMYSGVFDQAQVEYCLDMLRTQGSAAAPGFMRPEGIVIYHEAARIYFKKTIEKDEEWKGKSNA